MGAYVLRFTYKDKSLDIYRNNKTIGNNFFKIQSHFDCNTIKTNGKYVSVTYYGVVESIKDLMYFIREKNTEFENGVINVRTHNNCKRLFDINHTAMDNLLTFFIENGLENDDDTLIGEWVRL